MTTRPFDGQSAIITGASLGIGATTARMLAAQGANVTLCARNEEALRAVAAECCEAGGKAEVCVADVRSAEDMTAAVEVATKQFGRIDIAISNAGIARDNIFLRMTDDEWSSVIATNLTGAFNFARAVGRVMRKQKAGRLIFNASLAGLHGNANQANYAASKGGMIAMAKSLAKEWLPYGVKVNCVCPGVIDTEMTRAYPEHLRVKGLEVMPMGRFGTPDEVAGVILFLAGPSGDYMTGKAIEIDGGIEI
ncbi:MAG: 3-oxoacyl-ACP reductase FabG [Planctomycetota bacterium]